MRPHLNRLRRWLLPALVWMLCVWVIPAKTQDQNAIMDVIGEVRIDESEARAVLIIDELAIKCGPDSLCHSDSLIVACPSNEPRFWKTRFAKGDTLTLDMHVTRPPSRGFLWWGGHGAQMKVSIPQAGWTLSCSCDGVRDEQTRALLGSFVSLSGEWDQQLTWEGRPESWPARLLPYLLKGHMPEPRFVTISCHWATGSQSRH